MTLFRVGMYLHWHLSDLSLEITRMDMSRELIEVCVGEMTSHHKIPRLVGASRF